MGVMKDLWTRYGLTGGRPAGSGGRRGGYAGGAVSTELFSSPGLDNALKQLAELSTGRSYGILPELRHVSKYLRGEHGKRMRRHVSPDGAAWPKATFKTTKLPEPILGKAGPIAGNAFYNLRWSKLRTIAQVIRSREIIEKLTRSRAGKAGEIKVPALYRSQSYGSLSTAGSLGQYFGKKDSQAVKKISVAGKLFGMLTKDRVAGGVNRIQKKNGLYELLYGLGAMAARWAGVHQFGGGTFKGKAVPRRPFLGMNQANITYIISRFNAAAQRIISGKSSGSPASV
jgi:hypothetical protein